MRLLVAAVVVAAGAAAAAHATRAVDAAGACAAATVRYTPTRMGLPHVDLRGATGHVFYYTGATLMDGRVNGSDGLVLYAGGRNGALATKILWAFPPRRSGRALRVTGRRVDGAGTYTARFPSVGGGEFPSILSLPSAGCWSLTLRTGGVRRSLVAQAVEPRAAPTCDATAVHASGHPRFGDVRWLPATPSSSGIAAVGFVTTVPGARDATVYAGGLAPGGTATKFLWWSPRAGASLRLVGQRLDGAGAFTQTEQVATGATPPMTGPFFPSIVNVPAPGCWAVVARTGGRAGLVVFRAVPAA